MDESLSRQIRRRAGDACEYCRMPRALHPMPFEIDHVIAKKHHGATVPSNLALSCLHCNGHKGSNIAGIDPVTKTLTRLFHPRRHKWSRHFRWDGPCLVGRTAIGRVTVDVLVMNDPVYVAVRLSLIEEGLFPPA
jgi:hypothetical protein